MNKRNFVLGACTGLGAGLVQAAPSIAAQQGLPTGLQTILATQANRPAQRPDLLAYPSLASWRRYAGDVFADPQAQQALLLQAVEQQHGGLPGEQFTLVFVGTPTRAGLSVGTRLLVHPATAQQVPLYLQSAGFDAQGNGLWRAEFSRA